jgi:ankyrin repeat protein
MCGPAEIDGYAFCLGLDSLKEFYESRVELQSLIQSVTYLIRGAIFRRNYVLGRTGRVPQAICTLGELVDMYHNHEATLLPDKVYALLGMSGMSSDDLSKANLLPNYEVKWEELLQRLAKFLLCERISVETWSGKEIAVIKSKGYILGKISSVRNTISLGGRQGVDVTFKNTSEQLEYLEVSNEWSAHWTLQPSAKPIRDGDLICFLQGASKPTIIRLRKDHFVIIMIAASPLETGQTESEYSKWPKLFARDFLLVWDWKNSSKLQDLGEYDALVRTNDWVSEHFKTGIGGYLNKATRTWNVALILDDIEEYEEAEERLREAIEGYETAFGQKYLHLPKSQHGRTPLSWAAGNGYDIVVNALLKKDNISPLLKDSRSGRTPLLWAAENGHEVVVKLLLETSRVEVDSKDENSWTPLMWAIQNGHENIVKLLLETGKAEINLKDKYDRTPLLWAAQNGHETIIKLLLRTSKAEINSRDRYNQTPLSWAAQNGHEAIVKLLLETSKVEVDLKDDDNRTPLSLAAENGHEAIIKLLLKTGKVEVDSKDRDSRTPLWWATVNGHGAVIKLLLETSKVEVDSKDRDSRTPLSWAARNGHEAIVKLLLETGKIKVDSKDKDSWTPLSWAAQNGHEAIIKLLLETGKVKVNSKDRYGQTPLSWATRNGHETIVELLRKNIN